MPKRSPVENENIGELYEQLNLDILRPLARLISPEAPARKSEIVPFLTQAMTTEGVVRRMYDSLDEVAQWAVQEAVADRSGEISISRFVAKYRRAPARGTAAAPSQVSLFFPTGWSIPTDLRAILQNLVPKPRAMSIETIEQLPSTVSERRRTWNLRTGEKPESIPIRERLTATVALREFPTMLRLIESGKVKVSDKTRRPSQATVNAIEPFLIDGDYYQPEDRSEYQDDPGYDLAIRAYAWPCIIQAAGLTTSTGGKLGLAPTGRKALDKPAHEQIRDAWNRWRDNSLFDEFERVEAIKGKQSARLNAVVGRRCAVADTLENCPSGRWIAIDVFFRFLVAHGANFSIARSEWKLYIAELQYGSFSYTDDQTWPLLQGRFIMATLFEYAATLGLIDIAYIPPQMARGDFRDRWGTDDYSCLSRYDGLQYFRINELGAWCLGQSDHYQPHEVATSKSWRVLPNHDVVSSELNPNPLDVMFLQKVADRTSDLVWRLDREKILTATENGMAIESITDFLEQHSSEPIPQTVVTVLGDLQARATRVRDKGTVRIFECSDAETARLLLLDSKLKALCQPAGERSLVFKTADENKVRTQIRKLGYIIPSND